MLSSKLTTILIITAVVVALGAGFYAFRTWILEWTPAPEEPLPVEEVLQVAPPVERWEFQGMEYEIISAGGAVHDVITGELREEQVRILAEKIIGDVVFKNPNIEEVTLLFYSDIISAGAGEVDIARIVWTPNEITVRMTEE